MLRILILITSALPLGYFAWAPAGYNLHERYIDDHKSLAVKEMERTGVPASIKLAQALLESNAGRSELAVKARNHFGIKCGSGWNGDVFKISDDEKDEQGNPIPSCFRVYKSVENSYRDHSDFLRDPAKENRYGFLFKLDRTNYTDWANGLQKAGYATNPEYARALIRLIERHRLDQYDRLAADANSDMAGMGVINDIKVSYSRKDETLEALAERMQLPLSRLLRYNDHLYYPDKPLPENTVVFVQPKRNSFRGKQQFHKVQSGENMASIAQQYGIKLDKLRSKNRIPAGHEPLPGEKIKLRWRVKKNEIPRTKPTGPAPEQGLPVIQPPSTDNAVLQTQLPPAEVDPPVQPANQIAPAVNPPNLSTDIPGVHIVTQGETLFKIAAKYSIAVDQLKRINNLTSDNIKPGQKLNLK